MGIVGDRGYVETLNLLGSESFSLLYCSLKDSAQPDCRFRRIISRYGQSKIDPHEPSILFPSTQKLP